MSTSSCPRCGSKMMKIHNPNTPLWECSKCGYTGPVVIRDGNIEKQLRETKKLEKLSKKMLRGR